MENNQLRKSSVRWKTLCLSLIRRDKCVKCDVLGIKCGKGGGGGRWLVFVCKCAFHCWVFVVVVVFASVRFSDRKYNGHIRKKSRRANDVKHERPILTVQLRTLYAHCVL